MSQKGKQTKTGDQPKQQKPQQSQQQQQKPPQQSQQQQKPPQQSQQQQQQQQKPPQQAQQQSQQQPQSAPSTSSSRSLVPVSLPINIKLLPPLPPGTTNVLSKPAVVQTNMFPVSLNETLLNDVYQYSVSFSEAIPSSHTKRKFFYSAALLATVPFLEFMAFDGDAMAYSFRKFSDQTVDIAARMNDLIAKKQLYDEFGQLVTAAGSNLPHVTIKLTNHYLLGDSLTQIKSHGLTSTDSSANADDVKYRSELGSIITMSLSTLMRHSSAVFALHAERNRIRVKINKDPAYWKSPPGLAIRIQLSIEYFISRNGAIFRLDQFFNQTPQQIEQYAMGKGIYAVPAGFSALRFLQRGVLFNVASIVLPTYRIGQKVVEILEEIAPNGNLATAPQTVYKTILKYRAITNHLPDGKNSRVGLHTVGPKVKDCPTFLKDGKQVSIAKHFLDTYKIKLNPEYYTYAIVKSFQERTDKSGKLIKAHEETFYYPVEVLTLYSANNNCAKDLDPFQTKAMLTLMTKRPHHSLIAANDQLKSLQTAITYHQQQTPGSAADGTKSIYHGIQITATPISTTARVLPPPSAEFSNQTVPASAGEFKPRPDWKFVQSASNITSKIQVVVANLSNKLQRSPQMIDTYVENVIKIAQTKGLHMQLDTTQAVFTQGRFDGNAAKQLEQWARQLHSKGNQQKITYLVLAICDSNSEFYDALKRVGDGELGLVTQCADSAKIQKTFGSFKGQPPNPSSIASYVGNIILKINSKLGGLNYRLKPTKDIDNPVLSRPASKIHPTISNSAPLAVFGIDIFHNPGKRSHAGIVGSWDKSCSHYNGVLVQQPRAKNGKAEVAKEVINPATIQKAFVELLFQYAQKQPTLSLPQQMVVYRDGLSESQIALSMENEIPGIIAAAQQAYLTLFPTSTHKYEPTITFLIAVKRHHTFFVPQAGEDDPCGRARTENVRAGTVVDKEVVRSDLTEFYLQGHASALGTGKCTLYQVVYSSAPKTANLNDIQLLTNYLSYGHQRAFKSTRIPTPVYFADLLCYRGRSYASPSSQDGSWAFQDLPSALTARHFWL